MGRRAKESVSIRAIFKAEYRAWVNMLHRCHNTEHRAYAEYGARGIQVCDEWRDCTTGFMSFFMSMGTRRSGESLDRIDNSRGYSATNCRWADRSTQQLNRRRARVRTKDYGHGFDRYDSPLLKHEDRIQSLASWAKELGIKSPTIRQRLVAGLDVEAALSPVLMKPSNQGARRLNDILLPHQKGDRDGI